MKNLQSVALILRSFSVACAVLLPTLVAAQDVVQLGYGRLISNDFIGDLKDRGQTGSYVSSRIFGKSWNGNVPERAGEVLEFRLQADIKAPDNLVTPFAGDRPFAGSVSLGLHTHYQHAGFDISYGGELVIVGPQTRLDQFQTALHDGLGVAPLSATTRANQIANKTYPGAVVEFGRSFDIGSRSQLRPFFEGRVGVENLLRAGMDLEIGRLTRSDLMIRDGITGQRYRTITSGGAGLSFVVGVDTAFVGESAYLPASLGLTLSDRRDRARAGVHWQRKNSHGFFGVTYLGREFTTQADEQVVGSIRLGLKF